MENADVRLSPHPSEAAAAAAARPELAGVRRDRAPLPAPALPRRGGAARLRGAARCHPARGLPRLLARSRRRRTGAALRAVLAGGVARRALARARSAEGAFPAQLLLGNDRAQRRSGATRLPAHREHGVRLL